MQLLKNHIIPISLIFSALTLGGLLVTPLKNKTLGRVTLNTARTITVTGQAQKDEVNEIATFSAGVFTIKSNKEEALEEVNTKVEEIISNVKQFGIPQEDIKTENLSIYQIEESYSSDRQKGDWEVRNNISIKLRDVSKTSELTNLLTKSGATNVYGPSFSIEENLNKDQLLIQAIDNAKSKAQNMAQSLNSKIGKVLYITEGYNTGQIPMFEAKGMGAGGGGVLIEPGTSTVSATVTVTFELFD